MWFPHLTVFLVTAALTEQREQCRHPDGVPQEFQHAVEGCLGRVSSDCVIFCVYRNLGLLDDEGFPMAQKVSDLLIPQEEYPETNPYFAGFIHGCVEEVKASQAEEGRCKRPYEVFLCATQAFVQSCGLEKVRKRSLQNYW